MENFIVPTVLSYSNHLGSMSFFVLHLSQQVSAVMIIFHQTQILVIPFYVSFLFSFLFSVPLVTCYMDREEDLLLTKMRMDLLMAQVELLFFL